MKETTDETPLPLARMVTIDRPSFWIFIGCCLLLFVLNKFMHAPDPSGVNNDFGRFCILSAAFIGLLLNLITIAIKKPGAAAIFSRVCLMFEISTIVLLIALIIIK